MNHNGVSEIIKVARGTLSQNQYATNTGKSKSGTSRNIGEEYKNAVVELAGKVEQSWDSLEQLRNDLKQERNTLEQLRESEEQLRNDLEQERNNAEQERNDLNQLRNDLEQERNSRDQSWDSLEQERDDLKIAVAGLEQKWGKWNGAISPVRWFRSMGMKFLLCFLIVVLDAYCISSLLANSVHEQFAWIIGSGLSLSLLTFTVSHNKKGRMFSIFFSFVAAALYFDLIGSVAELLEGGVEDITLPLAKIAFSFVPPTINLILSDMITKDC